jgi:vitamin B12 transporter
MKLRLFVAFACFLAVFGAQAQLLDSIPLTEADVLSNRLAFPFKTANSTVSIVSRQEIARMPVQSVAEVLHYVVGLDVQQRGIMGVQADVAMRGSSMEQVLILVNGVAINDPSTGYMALNFPFDIHAIERIEVIRGAAARSYGINGLAGAINIVTALPSKDRIRVEIGGGALGYKYQQASIATGKKRQRNFISVRQDYANDYIYADSTRENTAFRMLHGFLQSNIPIGKRDLKVSAGYGQRNFGANGFYLNPDIADQSEKTTSAFGSVSMPLVGSKLVFTPELFYRRSSDDFRFGQYNSLNRDHTTQQIGFQSTGRYDIAKKLFLAFGAGAKSVSINSKSLGNHDRLQMSGDAELHLLLGRFSAAPGVSFVHLSDLGSAFNYGVNLGYQLGDHWRIYGNAGTMSRIPTYTELFLNNFLYRGDSNLQMEQAMGAEVGLRYKSEYCIFNANAFINQVERHIELVTKETPFGDYNNQYTNWRYQRPRQGYEAAGQIKFDQIFDRKKFIIPSLTVSYVYYNDQKTDPGTLYVTNEPSMFLASLDLRLPLGLKGNIRYKQINNSSYMPDYLNYQTLDARLMLDWKVLTAYVDLINLTNTKYTEVEGIPMPSRYFRVGVSLTLGRLLNN